MASEVDKLVQQIRLLPLDDQERVRQALDNERSRSEGAAESATAPDVEYQERLVRAGLLKQVRPRTRDQRAFERYQPVGILGKPLSETIVEERR